MTLREAVHEAFKRTGMTEAEVNARLHRADVLAPTKDMDKELATALRPGVTAEQFIAGLAKILELETQQKARNN